MTGIQRDAENEKIGARAAAGCQDPSQGDRHDEQVDQKHVGRKQPHGLGYVAFIGVFDHHDVKLPREQHDGAHGQKQHGEGGDILRIAAGVAKCEQAGEKLGLGLSGSVRRCRRNRRKDSR